MEFFVFAIYFSIVMDVHTSIPDLTNVATNLSLTTYVVITAAYAGIRCSPIVDSIGKCMLS